MDRLTALIAVAHLKLRLEMLTLYPHLLEDNMDIKRPMELAALKGRLIRAKKTEADISITGKRYDVVLDKIDELHGAAKGHVGGLEQYAGELKSTVEGMIAGSNEPEPETESALVKTNGEDKEPEEPRPTPGSPLGGPRIHT